MVDITGRRFGRLVALKAAGKNKWGNYLWECKCDCGNLHIVAQGKLKQGKSKSCGCYRKEIKVKQLEKHGLTTGGKPRTLIIWNGMKARCLNEKAISYKSYGARGIKICNDWLVFENFHNWAVANGYNDELTIDRINNDGDYEPSNCRWVTSTENKKNQRRTRYITVNGITRNITEWCKELDISRTVAYKYLNISDEAFIEHIRYIL